MYGQQAAVAIRICKYRGRGDDCVGLPDGVGLLDGRDHVVPLAFREVNDALRAARTNLPPPASRPLRRAEVQLLAPVDAHEVWGAGVTYTDSRQARMAETGDIVATVYDAVYRAPRPELFFKATSSRVVGPGEPLIPRADAESTIPEPELALWLDSDLSLLGIGLGNDLTARDVEAASPLYLPQAKIYRACCSLGPAVLACSAFEAALERVLTLTIRRHGDALFRGEMAVAAIRRPLQELVEYLGRSNAFPGGVVLLTGTGIVPPGGVTLKRGDEVVVADPLLGQLRNPIGGSRA